jgi:hypothetical protein
MKAQEEIHSPMQSPLTSPSGRVRRSSTEVSLSSLPNLSAKARNRATERVIERFAHFTVELQEQFALADTDNDVRNDETPCP